jgi:hypothetical protein
LPDLEAARHEAVLAGREMLAAVIAAGREDAPMRILIADEAGRVLGAVEMRDLLPRTLRELEKS